MKSTEIMALMAATVFFIGTMLRAYKQSTHSVVSRHAWMIPAFFSLAFGVYSMYTVWQEGFLALLPIHTANLWANQVWFDLLLAMGAFWYLAIEHMKKLNMRIWPWLVGIALSGSVCGWALLARILYLRARLN